MFWWNLSARNRRTSSLFTYNLTINWYNSAISFISAINYWLINNIYIANNKNYHYFLIFKVVFAVYQAHSASKWRTLMLNIWLIKLQTILHVGNWRRVRAVFDNIYKLDSLGKMKVHEIEWLSKFRINRPSPKK